jgi:hypothetical protein
MVECPGSQPCYDSQEPFGCQTPAVGELSHCCCSTFVMLLFLIFLNGLKLSETVHSAKYRAKNLLKVVLLASL